MRILAHVLSLHCHVHCAGRRPTVTGAWHLAVDRPPQEEPKQVTVFFIVGGIADREKVSYARYLQSSQERSADLCEVGWMIASTGEMMDQRYCQS